MGNSARAKVVIADDNTAALALMRCFVQSLGFSVIAVSDGGAALRAIEDHSPAFALLDISLPILTGVEVARSVREKPELASVRMIACTGHGDRELEDECGRAGFERYLVKPIDFGVLEGLLRG